MLTKKRSTVQIIWRLLSFLKPLVIAMVFAVLFGVLGHLSASFIPFLATKAVLGQNMWLWFILFLGVFRAVFRYLEQLLNHHIAFRILAEIRHHVFAKMSELAPAKMEAKNQGDLISMITSDIELIEVFYAHTISPILIFLIYLLIISMVMLRYSFWAFVMTLFAHFLIAYLIPKRSNRYSRDTGLLARNAQGDLSSNVLASIYGLFSISQFEMQKKQKNILKKDHDRLSKHQAELRMNYASNFMAVDLSIYFIALILLLFHRDYELNSLILMLVLYLNSFGPSIALANLGFDLQETLASAERIVDFLDEEAEIVESPAPIELDSFKTLTFKNVFFAYEDAMILKNINLEIKRGEIVGIKGKSGSGKSTLLKLMMRFWDPSEGDIEMNASSLTSLSLSSLRSLQSLMSQEALLFEDSIRYNISFNDPRFSDEDVMEAAKKAAIHDRIMQLENGYDTELDELGDSLSSGEKQRISLARMFLFNRDLWLLDEPTSNLDTYHEALILRSLVEHRKDQTIVLVSHRESSLAICDRVLEMKNGRLIETEKD